MKGLTYTIADKLYVSLTNECQKTLIKTLMETRGPRFKFSLPKLEKNPSVEEVCVAIDAHYSRAKIVGMGENDSGVTFAGYGVLTDWYVPSRWIDYLLGCGLALGVCLAFDRGSALRRFRELAQGKGVPASEAERRRLLPNALEEARWLGQEQEFRALLAQLEGTGPPAQSSD